MLSTRHPYLPAEPDRNRRDRRVEEIFAGFVDELEENDDHIETPPVSDDEEEVIGGGYERWRMDYGEGLVNTYMAAVLFVSVGLSHEQV